MNTFFSGTDVQELHDNVANYNPYYLSLIVNFKGENTAKIAYLKHIEKRDIAITDEDGVEKFITTSGRDVMFTFDLEVEIEREEEKHPIILQRLEEIRAAKKAKVAATTTVKGFNSTAWADDDDDRWKNYGKTPVVNSKQKVIPFNDGFTTKIRGFLPKAIMQDNKYSGNMWQAFIDVQKEIKEDPNKADFIYGIWADNIYEQVFEAFDCQDFDAVQAVFKEMIKNIDNLKSNSLYGDHVVKFIEILNIYITSIEVG